MLSFSLYIFNSPFTVFLFIPLFHSGITTHKKWLCFLHMVIIFFSCIYIIFTSYKTYLDVYIMLIAASIIMNHKITPSKLLKKMSPSPIILTPIEVSIYNKFFKKRFSIKEFKYLFGKGKVVKTKTKFYFVKENDKFDKIIFLAAISDKNSVVLRSQNEKIQYMEEGGWIGAIDFLYNQNEEIEIEQQKWKISVACEKEGVDITYIEWNIQTIKNIFLFSNDTAFLNRLLLTWNHYISKSIFKLNSRLSMGPSSIDSVNINHTYDESTYFIL